MSRGSKLPEKLGIFSSSIGSPIANRWLAVPVKSSLQLSIELTNYSHYLLFSYIHMEIIPNNCRHPYITTSLH